MLPVGAIHTFQVRTLRSMGYATRVALANKSHTGPAEFRTDYRVDLSIYANGARKFIGNIGVLAADARLVIDCSPYETAADIALTFHLVPVRFGDSPTAEIDREELRFLGSIQDHYVEYFREDGCAAGILYQTGPFNHPMFGSTATTLIQAPKYYVSTTTDSLLSVLNCSADPNYSRTARLQCALVGSGGQYTWSEEVAPFVPHMISMREILTKHGVAIGPTPTFACFYGICENATLIPLTFVRDDGTGGIGIEHSLPPDYYSPAMRGSERKRMLEQLRASSLFGGVR
jgi:hypothetical protein